MEGIDASQIGSIGSLDNSDVSRLKTALAQPGRKTGHDGKDKKESIQEYMMMMMMMIIVIIRNEMGAMM